MTFFLARKGFREDFTVNGRVNTFSGIDFLLDIFNIGDDVGFNSESSNQNVIILGIRDKTLL